MCQWHISTYVVSYVKLVANSRVRRTKAQSTGLVQDNNIIVAGVEYVDKDSSVLDRKTDR
jgi:hypothetical protein